MALWGTMTAGEFVVLDFTAMAAFGRLLINFLTHASLTIELLYPVLIWVRIMPPFWLAAVVAMHVGIAVTNPGLTEFALAMVAGNLAFFSGTVVTPVWRPVRLSQPVQGPIRRCLSSVSGVDGPDYLGRSRSCPRADRSDGCRRRIDPSKLDANGLHAGLDPVVSRAAG